MQSGLLAVSFMVINGKTRYLASESWKAINSRESWKHQRGISHINKRQWKSKTLFLIVLWYIPESMQNFQKTFYTSVQFSSVTQSFLTLCKPLDCSTPGLPVHHQLLKISQTHIHSISDALQQCHSLLSPSPLAVNLSQPQGLSQWVSNLHQVAKVLELQHQSF